MFLSGCAIFPNKFDETVQLSRFKDSTDTHLDSLIGINGYYAGEPDDSTYREHISPFMFFNDGTFGDFWFHREYPFLKLKNVYLPGKIANFYADMPGGTYVIKGDTIIVEKYRLLKGRWRLNRLRFKIIARDRLLLYERETDVSVKGKKTERQACHQFYIFVPATKPGSNFMPIRYKKWMWENKEEWKHNKELMKKLYPGGVY